MRIVEWNCQGAFRLKNERILSLDADILVIPECENPDKLEFGKRTPKPNDIFWYGDSANKGIGVFSYSDFRFELHKSYNPRFRYVIPLIVRSPRESFLLFAIWTMGDKINPDARYIGQVYLAINYYSSLFRLDSVLIGDFNSNQIWDYKDRVGNHSDVVDILREREIQSLYHLENSLRHGQEKDSTFFMHRNRNKTYHIDYCFASRKIWSSEYKVTLGQVDHWIDISDHIPLIVNFTAKLELDAFTNSLNEFFSERFQNFHPETKHKFSDLIDDVGAKADELDKSDSTIDNLKRRAAIIESVEKLFEIDRLIRDIVK